MMVRVTMGQVKALLAFDPPEARLRVSNETSRGARVYWQAADSLARAGLVTLLDFGGLAELTGNGRRALRAVIDLDPSALARMQQRGGDLEFVGTAEAALGGKS